jgi:hypothetical protein
VRSLVVAAPILAALTAAAPASAVLLDEPPRIFSFKLQDADRSLPLLRAFQNAEVERPGPMRNYLAGRWGRWREDPWWSLSWLGSEVEAGPAEHDAPVAGVFGAPEDEAEELSLVQLAAQALEAIHPAGDSPLFASTGPSFASNGFDALWEPPQKPVPWWKCRARPVTFIRYGAERKSFQLMQCDGAVAPGALDRLTLVARPPEVPSPGELLPDEPDAEAWAKGEWLPGVRPVHPRLLWLLQRVADAFPRRTIYVFSGYRPAKEATSRKGHHSMHAEARAMDVNVMGVPNAQLFKVCRTLDDVGCGYYPNSKFVHVDVRRPGTGRAFWVDASGPGEPSQYVDSWPGVVDAGGLAWDARPRDGEGTSDATSGAVTTAPRGGAPPR